MCVIHPIGITKIDWSSYISKTKEYLDYDPSKLLDSNNINLDNPSAFTYTINNGVKHVYASFMILMDKSIYDEFINLNDLNISAISVDRYEYYLIVSGSVYDWINTIVKCCSKDTSRDLRNMFNKIQEWFEYVNFKKLFKKYNKIDLKDGTWYYD